MAGNTRRYGLAAVTVGVIAWIVPSLLAGPTMAGGAVGGYSGMMGGYGGMMGGYGNLGTGGYLIGVVSQLGFILMLFGGAYLLYSVFVTDGGSGVFENEDSALEELRVAYARGDISDEEFEHKRARLQSTGRE